MNSQFLLDLKEVIDNQLVMVNHLKPFSVVWKTLYVPYCILVSFIGDIATTNYLVTSYNHHK